MVDEARFVEEPLMAHRHQNYFIESIMHYLIEESRLVFHSPLQFSDELLR